MVIVKNIIPSNLIINLSAADTDTLCNHITTYDFPGKHHLRKVKYFIIPTLLSTFYVVGSSKGNTMHNH